MKPDFSALERFEASLAEPEPPSGLPVPLAALWHAARGDWHRAHRMVQERADGDAAWVHAWLHRKEGDSGNAAYWYRRAGRRPASGDLEEEWRDIAATLLERRPPADRGS